MSVSSYEDLAVHDGHEFECVFYGPPFDESWNVSLECITCNEVMISFDREEMEGQRESPLLRDTGSL